MSKESWLLYLQEAMLPGSNAENLLKAHQQPTPISLRLHPTKGRNLYSNCSPVSWCASGRYLPHRPDFTLDPLFHAGAYYVQEASSMSIWTALEGLADKNQELSVLDLCAAPGGKSTIIASWLEGRGLLVANETIRTRAGILADNLSKWGYANTIVTNHDPKRFASLSGFFDIILVDAPCSGSGLFRKDPEAMEHWAPEAVQHCAARQERILEDVWPALKEDGLLLYSTCSYSVEENEEMAEKIMELGAEYLPIPKLTHECPEIVSPTTGYRFYPDKIAGEGFFLAAFRKTSSQNSFRNKNNTKTQAITGIVKDWILEPDDFSILKTHLGEVLIPRKLMQDITLILEKFHVVRVGLLPGQMAGKDFIPDHDLALSLNIAKQVPAVELDLNQALRFLKKETDGIPHPGKGWFLIKHQGLGLGWIKAVPGRINNYLPKHFRIRKEINREDNHYF